ncbi:hypothetical protein BDR05DRAFT_778767 [Suillus weaverae]|nr:hypothetical protein BDR05DRAFT_778767 [Suillus weaverae]
MHVPETAALASCSITGEIFRYWPQFTRACWCLLGRGGMYCQIISYPFRNERHIIYLVLKSLNRNPPRSSFFQTHYQYFSKVPAGDSHRPTLSASRFLRHEQVGLHDEGVVGNAKCWWFIPIRHRISA